MRSGVPDFVTHYHPGDREPFLNLSDLADPDLTDVLAQLRSLRTSGSKRVFGGRHMELRRLTEEHLPVVRRSRWSTRTASGSSTWWASSPSSGYRTARPTMTIGIPPPTVREVRRGSGVV
jgi:hypothetical protein